MLSSSACQNQQPTRKDSTAVLAGDTTRHILSPDDRALVLRARELDRADSLEPARAAYEDAARKLPQISDWLYLRAAGVTSDSAARAGYYARLRTDVSRARTGWTDAIARERTRDFAGAIRAYTALGARLDALRLRVSPPADEAAKAGARNDLLSFISTSNNSADTREAISLFDKVFKTTTPAEELAIARAASKSSLPDRAAAGYLKSLHTGLGDATDNFSYGTVLYRLRRFADAAAQFDRVRTPPKLAAAAQYQLARAQIALGNTEEGRATLRRITTAYATDTSAASALLLLADLATDDNRDQDARQALLTLLKRFPSGRHATSARFRAGMISYIQGDRKSAAAQLDSLVSRDSNSSEALAAGYWAGRSYAALGDKVKSKARWRSVIKQDPLSYYAVMSAKRLDTTLVAKDASSSAPVRIAAIDSVSGRVAALKDVGMDVEAGFENDKLFRDALADPTRLVATASALAGSDQASRSIALGKRAIDDIGGTPANYRLYFPVLERETLIASSRENGLDPVLVAALIRQESNFNPLATSPVGARGLMQLMPDVGRSLASAKGIGPWNPDILYEPATNIRLGTAHLSSLMRKYPDVVKSLAAYNAGESRVAKWSTKTGAQDPEVFTERIPFVETRDYVRTILRNRAYYQALYPW
ncbi:MAG: soluble lytic murein transglycosylase [Gemmatimonadaceae bacterium]|jgi:soluble lytic murein transglycosylase|nr:soluble lytic murein transglycosylase [Gemmatimonadaceae bacterium]